MNSTFQPLVVTPQPIISESLMGLILRTSEANGYSSPNYILRYAGIEESDINSTRLPLNKIASLYCKSPNELAKFYPDPEVNKRTRSWNIANHNISSLHVNIKSKSICPECVSENGFINSLWDIKFICVCTKHKRELISFCIGCKKQLRWQRKGLLTCSCGQNLIEVRGDQVTDSSLLSITELIQWKLNNHQNDETPFIKEGFPLSELKKMSLSTLLGIIERLQTKRKRKTIFPQPLGEDNKLNPLKLAFGIFAKWPNGFYDFLEALSPENRNVESRNVQAQYRNIFNSLFSSGLPIEEINFVRKAFVTFANERLGDDVYIDARLATNAETSRRFVGIYGLAKHLNIKLPTVRNYVKKGILKPKTIMRSGREIKVFDLHKLPFKASEGRHLKQREAARFIHVKEPLLKILKKNDVYKIKRLGWGMDGYSELDLIEFRNSIINKAPKLLETVTENLMPLRNLLRKSIYFEEVAKVVDDIIKGNLLPIGRVGNEIQDIVVSKIQLSSYIKI